MLCFDRFRLGVLSPPKDFFGNGGLSVSELTFGERTYELLVGMSVERLTHDNRSKSSQPASHKGRLLQHG